METFKNPPIQEALLDIAVALPEETTNEVLASYQVGLEARFPTRKERRKWTQGLEFSSGNDPKALLTPAVVDGFLFVSESEGKIVQSRRDGFTFNKLRPYSDWSSFSQEARQLWTRYCELAKPKHVTRIGLRFINRIEIPLPFADFREYCFLFRDIPKPIPHALSEFFLRFIAPTPDWPGISGIVTLTFSRQRRMEG